MEPFTVALGLITMALRFANSDESSQIVTQAKNLFSAFRNKGLITEKVQYEADHFVEETGEAFLRGDEPPSWNVEPDPVVNPVVNVLS